MVRPRTRANQNPQESDLANIVATSQRQLMEQQRETDRLREQIARFDQIPRANVGPPQGNPVPPVVPQVPEGHQKVPRNVEVPLASIGVQANIPLIREDMLYERFRRMKEKVMCASFALKKDARHWWMTVQMRRNVTTMSWQDFIIEFRAMYYNREILAVQQDEFNSFRQGSMIVMEAVKKFEQLASLCPELVPNETKNVRRMMKMFRTDIAKQVSAGSSLPTLVSDSISRVIRAEYWINQDKEARAQIFKTKKEEKVVAKQSQPRENPEPNMKGLSSNASKNPRQFGKNKRKENATSQGQQGNYPQKKINRVKIKCPHLAQERLEAPEPQTRY
ncbi:hypothetical protein TIFTF001_042956 [Ficus carica]|uniref:Retrotransposon gag domain-containing protein n=1 Tax=Ficus carica TaxID=3494 RepID=A0AA87YPI8_FICCA|nr:hypothetical protein TIFTF001_042956 [Ficus carica]